MADTYSAQGLVMNGILPLGTAAVMLVGMFGVMMSYDWTLSLVALVVCPPLYLAITRINGRIQRYATASKEAESALYARTETTIGAVKLVQAYGREDGAVADFRRGSEESLQRSAASSTAPRRCSAWSSTPCCPSAPRPSSGWAPCTSWRAASRSATSRSSCRT